MIKTGANQANVALADFIAPVGTRPDWIGGFAVTAGHGIEEHLARFKADQRAYLNEWPMSEEQKQEHKVSFTPATDSSPARLGMLDHSLVISEISLKTGRGYLASISSTCATTGVSGAGVPADLAVPPGSSGAGVAGEGALLRMDSASCRAEVEAAPRLLPRVPHVLCLPPSRLRHDTGARAGARAGDAERLTLNA